MGVVAWEVADGGLRVYDGPVRAGRARFVKDAQGFFRRVKAITPPGGYGLDAGSFGLSIDPGIFARPGSLMTKEFDRTRVDATVVVGMWTPRQRGQAEYALTELVGHEGDLMDRIMAFLERCVSEYRNRPVSAHARIHDAERGIDAVTRRYGAAALRRLLFDCIGPLFHAADVETAVRAVRLKGQSFIVSMEEHQQRLDLLHREWRNVRAIVKAGDAATHPQFAELSREVDAALEWLAGKRLWRLVSSRHPNLGKHGARYQEGLHGSGREVERARALMRFVRDNFACVPDILSFDQIAAGAAI